MWHNYLICLTCSIDNIGVHYWSQGRDNYRQTLPQHYPQSEIHYVTFSLKVTPITKYKTILLSKTNEEEQSSEKKTVDKNILDNKQK